MKRSVKAGLAALAVASAACSENGLAPDTGFVANVETAPVCETIDFSGPGHMEAISSINALGLTLTVTGHAYVAADGSPTAQDVTPVVFYTQLADSVEDDDLQSTPPWGDCAACAGLGNIMTLPDIEQNPAAPGDPELPAGSPWVSVFYGDYRWGGTMRISGFSGGDYYVESFKAVDQENTPGRIALNADGTDIGTSTGLGDGSVETVATSQTTFTSYLEFTYGTPEQDQINGSGGVDDIVICRVPPPPPSGEGTRTPGYWKNDKKDWPVDQLSIGGVVYTRAQADDLMEHPTAKDKTYNMFEQLVATKLNIANGTDASCIAAVAVEADAWMAAHPVGSGVAAKDAAWKNPIAGNTMSAGDLHSTLDAYNNGLLCAPHAD